MMLYTEARKQFTLDFYFGFLIQQNNEPAHGIKEIQTEENVLKFRSTLENILNIQLNTRLYTHTHTPPLIFLILYKSYNIYIYFYMRDSCMCFTTQIKDTRESIAC